MLRIWCQTKKGIIMWVKAKDVFNIPKGDKIVLLEVGNSRHEWSKKKGK